MQLRAPVRALVALLSGLAVTSGCAPGDEDLPPTADERLADWATLPEGTSVPVALGFGTVVPDSVVAALLERQGLRPYAVHVRAAGAVGVHRRERSRASLEVLAEAREEAVAQLRTSLCAQKGRARSMIADSAGGADPLPAYRELLSRFYLLRKSQPELELGGAPMIYGVEAVGELEAVRAVGSDPVVTTWEPAWRGRVEGVDSVIVPEPPAPSGGPEPVDAESAALSADEVRARMVELAEDAMGSCTDETRPEEPAP